MKARGFCIFAMLLTAFIPLCEGQTRVNEVVPEQVYLESNGREVSMILRGTGLKNLVDAEAEYQGRTDSDIYAQLGSASDNRVSLVLIARPDTPTGAGRLLKVKDASGTWAVLPVRFEVVAPGDSRATKPDTASALEAVQAARGKRVVIAEAKAPVVTETVPNPLYVEPNGRTQTLLLRGRNLSSVTDVRVRRAESPPRYRNQEGILPSRFVKEALEVDVLATASSAVGEKFCLDLMIKDYLAATVGFCIGKPVAPVSNPSPGPRVIEIPPLKPPLQ